jgi:hypothetical protein
MNPILAQALKTAVPGHKGRVIGSKEDMIERALKQSKPKVIVRTVWDPNHMTYVTRHYSPEGVPMPFTNKMFR